MYLLEQPALVKTAREELKDKILACWCAPQPCHGRIFNINTKLILILKEILKVVAK